MNAGSTRNRPVLSGERGGSWPSRQTNLLELVRRRRSSLEGLEGGTLAWTGGGGANFELNARRSWEKNSMDGGSGTVRNSPVRHRVVPIPYPLLGGGPEECKVARTDKSYSELYCVHI